MSKHIKISEEAFGLVSKTVEEINGVFGKLVNSSVVIDEMILNSKIDVKAMQIKHIDLHQLLRSLSSRKDLEVEDVARAIAEYRTKGGKKRATSGNEEGV
jgi:hypothetical protein